jgi:hypothetical protein
LGRVAILNETAAREYFPGRSQSAKRLAIGKSDELNVEIVGVVKSEQRVGPSTRSPVAYAYNAVPAGSEADRPDPSHCEATGTSSGSRAPIREAVRRLTRELPCTSLQEPCRGQISESLLTERLIGHLLGRVSPASRRCSPAIGIYGVLAFSRVASAPGGAMAPCAWRSGADPVVRPRGRAGRDVLRFVRIGGAVGHSGGLGARPGAVRVAPLRREGRRRVRSSPEARR